MPRVCLNHIPQLARIVGVDSQDVSCTGCCLLNDVEENSNVLQLQSCNLFFNAFIFFCLRWQIMCRCSTALENSVKEKISMFCHVEPQQVGGAPVGPDRAVTRSRCSSKPDDPSSFRSSACTTCHPSTECRYCWKIRVW